MLWSLSLLLFMQLPLASRASHHCQRQCNTMWNISAKFLIFILYNAGSGFLLLTGLSVLFFSNGSVALELTPGGKQSLTDMNFYIQFILQSTCLSNLFPISGNPALRYYEPIFYNPSEFLSQHRRKKREIRNSESLRLKIASQSR